MKRLIALPLIAALAFSVTACAKNAPGDNVSETTFNETVTDNVSTTDDLGGGNTAVGNDTDVDTTNSTVVTTNTQ